MQPKTEKAGIHLWCCAAGRKAFSLAEVVISLGIAALGFISLLGLLPQGLEMTRRAANLAIESRIVQQINAELNSTPWDQIQWSPALSQLRYFDDQGIEVQLTDTNAQSVGSGFSYVACATVNPGGSGREVNLPGGGTIKGEPFIRRMSILVASSSNPNFSFDEANSANFQRYTVVLAKQGHEMSP